MLVTAMVRFTGFVIHIILQMSNKKAVHVQKNVEKREEVSIQTEIIFLLEMLL